MQLKSWSENLNQLNEGSAQLVLGNQMKLSEMQRLCRTDWEDDGMVGLGRKEGSVYRFLIGCISKFAWKN
jgi:hypothetical protein